MNPVLGGDILGGVLLGSTAADTGLVNLYSLFRLELVDADDARIAVMLDATGVSIKESLNEPGTLDFNLPSDAWYIDQVSPPNGVALYDNKGLLVQIYEIVTDRRSFADEDLRSFSCADPLYLLNDDSIAYQNYTSTTAEDGDPRTAGETLADIINLQANTGRRIRFGVMDAVLAAKAFRIGAQDEYQTPLSLIKSLRDVVGGFFSADSDRRINWRSLPNNGRDAREIRWAKNLMGFTEDIDHDAVVTHLRYLGERTTSTEQVSLPDPGYLVSSTYVDGDRERWHTVVDTGIKFQDTLIEVAELFHGQFFQPEVRATVNILDLSKSAQYDYDDWHGVLLGDQVNVYHPKLGTTPVLLTVVGRSVDLADPLAVQLELGSLPVDITRIVADIRYRQHTRERGGGGGGGTDVVGFEIDPLVFALPGTPGTIAVGDSPLAIRSDAVLPILPDLGTYLPEPILPGLGLPGAGPYAAPQDHSHPLDPLDLLTDFGDAGFTTDGNLGEQLTGILNGGLDNGLHSALAEDLGSDTIPEQIVSQDAVSGSGTKFARFDHTHVGMPMLSVPLEDELPTDQPEGVLCLVDDTGMGNSLWAYINATWIPLTVPVVLALPPIPSSGMKEVYWTSAGAGTGDDQVWRAYAGQIKYRASQFTSTLDGVPEAP